MLEKQLSVLLATYLNRFICDLNEEQLRLSLWSGDLVLRDLELRSNIVDQIALSLFQGTKEDTCGNRKSDVDAAEAAAPGLLMPFTVLKGVVKELVIGVPWSALDREPISVEVQGVEIVLCTLRGKPYNPDEDTARVQMVKQKQLQVFELGRLSRGNGPTEQVKKDGKFDFGVNSFSKCSRSYVETLIETITRNIHIVFRNVSIKYVVDYQGLANCFTCALVVAVEDIYVTTTDEEWEDRFIVDLSMPYRKKVVVGGIQVSVMAFKEKEPYEIHKGRGDDDTSMRWQEKMCVASIEEHLTLCLQFSGDEGKKAVSDRKDSVIVSVTTTGLVKLRLSFGAMGTMLSIIDSLRNGLVGVNYRHQLHHLNSDESGDLGANKNCDDKRIATWAKRRWMYALNCAIDICRVRKNGREGHSFIDSVLDFCKRRREYCVLWKRAQGVAWMPNLTADEKNALSALEKVLTLEQLVFLRCLAYAELRREKQSMTQQKLYITDAMRKTQSKTQTTEFSNGPWKQQQEQQQERWWWWLFRRRPSVTEDVVCQEDECATGTDDAFVAEWAFGHQFLQKLETGRIRHSMMKSSSSCNTKSGNPIAMQVHVSQLEVEFHPDIWRRDIARRKPLLSYLENIQQYLQARFSDIECKYMMSGEPTEDQIGLIFDVGSFDMCFLGPLSSPLFHSVEKPKGEEGEVHQVGVDCKIPHSGPWLSIKMNETFSKVGVVISTSNITLHPLCELRWWVSGVSSFLSALEDYVKPAPTSHTMSRRQCSSPTPVVNVVITNVVIRMLLTSLKSEEIRELSLHVPNIILSSMSEHSQGSCDVLAWHLSAGGGSPVRLCCEGFTDVVTLSRVNVDVTLSKGLSVVAQTDMTMIVEPMVLAFINDHMGSLVIEKPETGTTLVRVFEENNWMWRLKTNDTMITGDTVMTFPATSCRSYLTLLYQIACTHEETNGKVDTTPTQAPSATVASPLLQFASLDVDFVHVTLRSVNHEDIAHIILPARASTVMDDVPSLSHSSFSPAREVLKLEMTSSETDGHRSFVMRMPGELHVSEVSGGRQLLVTKALMATYHSPISKVTVKLEVLDVLFCHSLVDCIEVLLSSCTSLKPIPNPSFGFHGASGVTYASTVSDNTCATSNAVEEMLEVTLQRLSVRVLLERVGRSATMSVHDLAFRANNGANNYTVTLQGKFDVIEYIAETDGKVKTFPLFVHPCGLTGDAQTVLFDCTVEKRIRNNVVYQTLISFNISGTRINVYCAYWMELLSLSHDSAIVRLASLPSSQQCTAGYSTGSVEQSVRQSALFQKKAAAQNEKSFPVDLTVRGEVQNVEFFVSTNLEEVIDIHDTTTFVYLCVERVALKFNTVSSKNVNGLSKSPFRLEVDMCNMSHASPDKAVDMLCPFIPQTSLVAESHVRLEPCADGSGYEYAEGNSEDTTLYLVFGLPQQDSCRTGNSGGIDAMADGIPQGDAAMNMKLTLSMLNSLRLVLSRNVLASRNAEGSAQSVNCASESVETLVNSKRTFLLVTVPSARFVLINNQDIFSLCAQLQFYSFTGSDENMGGKKTSKHAIHVRNMTLTDISPSRCVLRRDVPQWEQCGESREVLPGHERRLVEIESGSIFTYAPPKYITVELALKNVILHPVRCSLTALAGMFTSCNSLACSAASNTSETAVESANVPSTDDFSPSFLAIILKVHQCTVYLEEPWEEPLAVLSLRSFSARAHHLPEENILEVLVNKGVSLVPCHGSMAGNSVLQWGDLGDDVMDAVFLRINLTFPRGKKQEYRFDTPYEEQPQVFCTPRVEVILGSAGLLLSDAGFFLRLSRLVSSEASAYASLLTVSTPAMATPVTSVPVLSLTVKEFQIILPTPMKESFHETCWRFTLGLLELSSDCVNTVVSDVGQSETCCMRCFTNVYSVKLCDLQLECGRLSPILLPNMILRAEVPILNSVYKECESNASITPRDRVYLRPMFVFISPSKPVSSPSSTPAGVLATSSYLHRRVHLSMEEKACLSFSVLHVRDVLMVLPLLLSNSSSTGLSDAFSASHSFTGNVPLFYTAPPLEDEIVSYSKFILTIDFPRFSICLTDGARGAPPLPSFTALGEEEGVDDKRNATVFAELLFIGALSLSISFNVCTKTQKQVHAEIKGVFKLLDSEGVVAVFGRETETYDMQNKNLSGTFPASDDIVGQLEIVDTLERRHIRVNSHGITVTLERHSVEFMLQMYKLVTYMYRKEFLDDPFLGQNTSKRVTESDADASRQKSSSAAVISTTGAPKERESTMLKISISVFSFILDNTALLKARNMEVSLEWGSGLHISAAGVPYHFFVEELSLSRISDQCDFVSVSSLDVTLGLGQVSVRAMRFILNNYDTLFYMDLWDSTEALQYCYKTNVKFSKNHGDGFKQVVVVCLVDFRVCFPASRKGLVDEAVHGAVEFVFPIFVVRHTVSTSERSLMIETERGIIRYRHSLEQDILPPFVENIQFMCFVDENYMTHSRAITVNLGSVEAFIPLGETLQCCVEAVAQAVMPLVLSPFNLFRGDSTAAVALPLGSDELTFGVPLVSLHVCAPQSEEAVLVKKPTVLFGVSVHTISFERSHTGVNEKILAKVLSVTSTVDVTIQKDFISMTAPHGALDTPSKWALYYCREISSTEADNGVYSSCRHSSSTSGEGVNFLEQLPARFVNIIARAHAVKFTVSPQLLEKFNEHFLMHIASGVYRTRSRTVSWSPSRNVGGDPNSARSHSSAGDLQEKSLIISSDFCLKSDLILGGIRGSRIRFTKKSIERNPSNQLNVTSINLARVFLTMGVTPEGVLQPPIVVDPGLTVVFHDVPFVFEHGKLMDYVQLGPRSLFLVPSELLAATTTTNSTMGDFITPATNAAAASLLSSAARWYNLKVNLDVSTDFTFQLWSKDQMMSVTGDAYARYKLEKNCFEGNRGVRDFMDESGEVALTNVSILCDSGSITRVPTGVVLHVKHHKLNEDSTNAGMSVARAVVSSMSFKVSIGHLRLLYETVNQVRQGLNHISSTMGMKKASDSVSNGDVSEPCVSFQQIPSSFKSKKYSVTTEPSLLWSGDGELVPLVEISISAPHIEFILTNDFYRPEVTVTLNTIALLAKGGRCFKHMTCAASMTVNVTDFPPFQSSREILVVSPEVAMEYTRYLVRGFALQGALTFHRASVTLPLVTVLRLIRCRHALQRTDVYSFRNNIGTALVLVAVGGMKEEHEESKQFCCLPPGELVKVTLFHYNQTRFCIVLDDKEHIHKYCGGVSILGPEVDLSVLQHGVACRFPLPNQPRGLLHAVMRLNETERVVDITTSLMVNNELMEYVVCLPATVLEPFVVGAKESRYATLSCLRQPFSLMVGEWRLRTRNELITLESLISAFCLLSDSHIDTEEESSKNSKNDVIIFPRCTYMDGDDTLVMPLSLIKEHQNGTTSEKDEEGFGVLLVLKRRVAVENELRTSRFLPRYDVEMSICPLVTVVNLTGEGLAVSIPSSCSFEESIHEPCFLRGAKKEFNCFTRFWEGENEKAEEEEELKDKERQTKEKRKTPVMNLMCELENGVRLCSSEPLPLTFSGVTTVGMKVVGSGNAFSVAALTVERAAYGKFIVRVVANLVNALPFSVEVYDEFNVLLLGQRKGVGLAPGCKLPVMLPVLRQCLPKPDSSVYLQVQASTPTAKLSQMFACGCTSFSGMLQSIDEDVVHIFRVQCVTGAIERERNGNEEQTMGIPCIPVLRLESGWIFRNQSRTLSLLVRCVGLTGFLTIGPQSEAELTTFALSSAADPLVQVRYIMSGVNGIDDETGKGLFAWSELIKVVTISSSVVPITKKLYLRALVPPVAAGEDITSVLLREGVTTLNSMRIPMMPGGEPVLESFACLSITPSRQKGGQYRFDFTLDRGAPVVVENRTKQFLQYEAIQNTISVSSMTLQAYVIKPFTDGVACFEGENATPVIRLTLYGENAVTQTCTVDLTRAVAAHETVKTSNGMFALCTYDHNLQRYYVSVTTDHSLESTFVFQPSYIVHVEMFVRSLSLHIASICVPTNETSLRNTPLAALVAKNQLCLGHTITANSSNAEVLSALKCRELDVIHVQAVGIYCTFSLNEKHFFGRLDIGRMALIDCTSPRPLYPVFAGLNVGEVQSSFSDDTSSKPSLSMKLHVLLYEKEGAAEGNHTGPVIITIPLQYVRIDLVPITLRIADTLLFMLRQAATCVLETMDKRATRSVTEKLSSVEVGVKASEASLSSQRPEDPVVYNLRIKELVISRIDLDLTLTRRGDGRFDPFAGSTLGSRLIPSVERAPLSINGIEMRDIIQRSNSPYGPLISILWPFYRNQLLLQLYKIIGSLEILGNPISLVNGLQKGVRSFVLEAAEMNPMKGAREFFFATASSTLHSVGLISRMGSRTAATISLDSDWLEAMDESGRNDDAFHRYGVLWGIAEGLRGGIEGAVTRPLRGARTSGIAGFCTGIATGAIGLLTRPVVGVLDGFGNTAEFYSKLLQEPNCIPTAQQNYLVSNRNFCISSSGASLVESSLKINSDGVSPAALATVSADTINTTSVTSEDNILHPRTSLNALQREKGSGSAWGAAGTSEFVSLFTYNSLQHESIRSGLRGREAARLLIRLAGINNYALYACWASFVAHATPEEFYDWVHIAITAVLKEELETFLSKEFDSTNMSHLLLVTQHSHGSDVRASSQESENMMVVAEAEAMATERARNIKNTLGTRDLFKYVSLYHCAQVCSLDEIKQFFPPDVIHKKLPNLLLPCIRNVMQSLLAYGGG